MEKRWLSIEVHPGMFPTERVAEIRTVDGHSLSLFVGEELVREGGRSSVGRGQIQVDLLQSASGVSLVGLPAEAVEGPRVAKVAASELSK